MASAIPIRGILGSMTDTVPPFLNVAHSLSGKRWQARPYDERLAWGLAQGRGLPEIVGRVLAARGVTEEACDGFLNPTLKALLPDPSRFKDMDIAAERIARAIMDGEPVAVFGDYDVDGATSSALLRRFFRAVGADLRIYVPDRMKEGYGPQRPGAAAAEGRGRAAGRDGGLRHLRLRGPGGGGGGRAGGGGARPSRGGTAPAAGRRPGQPEPAGRGRRLPHAVRGGGHLPGHGGR
ncbi:protein of unknown function [Azospirillum baldaniorum]|uniref:Single-stranded-DNA-specific exonuclease RecJ n=1 Tax=Azospirillum baldaniorum TaxID=1064539 RepID=A0A9P1NLV1_9PROT|nr:protein of unknown function [Azospirillum baldaniorum]